MDADILYKLARDLRQLKSLSHTMALSGEQPVQAYSIDLALQRGYDCRPLAEIKYPTQLSNIPPIIFSKTYVHASRHTHSSAFVQ